MGIPTVGQMIMVASYAKKYGVGQAERLMVPHQVAAGGWQVRQRP
jgi:hypothetical protein